MTWLSLNFENVTFKIKNTKMKIKKIKFSLFIELKNYLNF